MSRYLLFFLLLLIFLSLIIFMTETLLSLDDLKVCVKVTDILFMCE